MNFKKTLEALLVAGGLFLGAEKADSQSNLPRDSTSLNQIDSINIISKPFIGLQIIENEPNENYSQEEINNIKNQYQGFINNALNELNILDNGLAGFSSIKNTKELINLWGAVGNSIWSQYQYQPQTWLTDGIKTNLIDCDLSAFVAGDIMNQFNLNSKIIYVPNHAFLYTEIPKNFETKNGIYIETTNTSGLVYETKEEMREEYPIIHGEAEFDEKFPKIEKHYIKWVNCMDSSKYESALEEISKAISISPIYWLYTSRAHTNVCLDRYFGAMNDLDSAQSMDPNLRIILEKADVNRAFGFFEKAIENYNEILKNKKLNNPEDVFATKAKTNLEIASELTSMKNLGVNEIVFYLDSINNLVSKINYKDYENKYGKSPEKEFLARAHKDFSNAIELNSDIAYFYIGRARVKLSLRLIDDALKDFESAIEIAPQKAWKYHVEKAKINIVLNQNLEQQALFELNLAIKKAPEKEKGSLAGLYYQRALLEDKVNDWSKSLRDYDTALHQYDKSSKDFVFLLENKGVGSGALCLLENFKEVSWKILPDDTLEIIKNRGKCYYALKNYKKALNDFNKVLPNKDSQIYYLMSESKRYLGDYKSSIENLNYIFENFSSINYPRESYELFFRRGTLYEKINSRKEAINDYSQAIKEVISKEDFQGKFYLTQSLYNRANLKKKIGDKRGSKKDLRVLKELHDGVMEKEDFQKFYKRLF